MTTQEINDAIISQIEAELGQVIPLGSKSFSRVIARALAGVFVILYKYVGYSFLQMFVGTASIEFTTVNGRQVSPLREWGDLVGIGAPKAATRAECLIDITVELPGQTIASGTQLLHGPSGVVYALITGVVLNGAITQATVRAVSDQSGGDGSGSIGNRDPGEQLDFLNPITGAARETVVSAQTVTASDGEAVEDYRRRILDRFQKQPQGGAYADYELWAEEAPDVINAYPYTGTPGVVNVYIEVSGQADGVPTQAQLDAARDSCIFDEDGFATRNPVGSYVRTLPITRSAFDVAVSGLNVGDPAAVQSQIETALTEYFLERAPYIVGLTVTSRRDRITESAVAGVVEDIVSAAGGIFSTVSLELNGASIDVYTLGEGEKSKLGALSFV